MGGGFRGVDLGEGGGLLEEGWGGGGDGCGDGEDGGMWSRAHEEIISGCT